MPNITSVLNEQIRRLARREIRNSTGAVRRATAQYRRDIAALKRHVASLSKTVVFLEKQESRRADQQPVPQPVDGLRFRADGLKSHRAKLLLSAQEYGRLVGVTGQTVYDWESGQSRPRQQQVVKLAAVRGIGKREAMKRLELMGGAKAEAPTRRYTRRPGGQTAQEFIVALVKEKKANTTAAINAAWQESGRPGRANNTLTTLLKAGSLSRAKLEDGRGSQYLAR